MISAIVESFLLNGILFSGDTHGVYLELKIALPSYFPVSTLTKIGWYVASPCLLQPCSLVILGDAFIGDCMEFCFNL